MKWVAERWGHTRQFSVDVALDRALEVFWARVYQGATLPELTRSIGINRPGLYAAFINEDRLFRKALDRHQTGPMSFLQALDKLNYSLVDLLGSLLLGPMTATWKQKRSPELRYKLRQVGDDLVHPTKGQNEIAVPGDVQRRDGHLHPRNRR